MRAKLLRGFLLEDIKVEPLKGLITTNGTVSHLSPEALDVLLHLASQPTKVLSREKLIEEVWGSQNGNPGLLDRTVTELFRALGENPDRPRFIETLPESGYRLLAEVEVMNFSGSESAELDTSFPAHLPLREIHGGDPTGTLSLWEELKQRRVVRVGIGYLIMAWLILQVADVILRVLELPDWSMKLLTLLLAVGFVIALVISWLLQITPSGMVLDTVSGRSRGSNLQQLVELAIVIVLLVGSSVLVYRQIWSTDETRLQGMTERAPPGAGAPVVELVPLPPYEQSIAVLPFVNLGENPADKYFGDGLAEELLHKLVRVKALKVAARTSSFSLVGKGLDIPTIARQLHVMTVLEGSIRREQDRVRVTAQLVDAEGFHLWSDIYDHKLGEIFNVQSDIAIAVARRILDSVTPDASASLMKSQTDIPEAFDAYLQGLEYLRRPRQPVSLKQASDWFEQALSLDPRFVRAWAASCETELSWYGLNRDIAHFERAERQCNRTLTLDSRSHEAYTALGNLYRTSSQFEEARQYFEQGLDINPYNEEATYGLARVLQGLGDLKGAEQLLLQGIELEPGYWGPYMALGTFLFRMGRYQEAATYYSKVTELTPDNPDGYTNLGSALFQADNWEDAEVAWERSLGLAPSPMAFRNMGTIYYYRGRYQDAAAMHREAVALAPEDHWLWGKLAAAYLELAGEEENARAAYERAIELASKRLEVEATDGQTMAYLAAYHVNTGLKEQAAEFVTMAVELDPENPETWYFAGLVNTRLGKLDQAADDIALAVEMGYSRRLLAADPQLAELRGLEEIQRLIL